MLTSSAPRVTNVNFDITVGTVVPRTVRIAPVPVDADRDRADMARLHVLRLRDEIIIVEPRTLEIVAVLEV